MMEDVALSRTFGEEAGRWFHELLESKGVEIHGGEELEAFEGDGASSAVVTKSGRDDRVRRGRRRRRGAARRDARRAGRARGRRRDRLRREAARPRSRGSSPPATAAPTTASIHGRRLRVEHWDVALQQGQHAARAMLGDDEPLRRRCPYFFSDLADWASLEYVGPAEEWDEEIWRGDRDAGEFSVWYLKDGKVAGALGVGRSEDLVHARHADRGRRGRLGDEAKARSADAGTRPGRDLTPLSRFARGSR